MYIRETLIILLPHHTLLQFPGVGRDKSLVFPLRIIWKWVMHPHAPQIPPMHYADTDIR